MNRCSPQRILEVKGLRTTVVYMLKQPSGLTRLLSTLRQTTSKPFRYSDPLTQKLLLLYAALPP